MNRLSTTGSRVRARDCRTINPAHPEPDVAIVRRIDMSLLTEELARDRMRQMRRDLEEARRARLIRTWRRPARSRRS